MSDWATIGASLGGVVLGGVLGNLSARWQSRLGQEEVRQRAWLALYAELEFVWTSIKRWDRLTPMPVDAFEGAKPYLAELPRSVTDDIYNGERTIGQFNATVALKLSGMDINPQALDGLLEQVERQAGNAYGSLLKYLEPRAERPSRRWARIRRHS
jgi:hypothetical protein